MREIGSEYYLKKNASGNGIELPRDVIDFTFTFSGRTSIETVLKNEQQIKKVMLPSYCCASIIDPFRKIGIEICFYDVNYNNGLKIDLRIKYDIDAIFWCNYFGFKIDMPDLTGFIENGGIVIEDITHSFFSKQKYNVQSHYLIASLRKWEPVLCGGYCASVKKMLKYKPNIEPSSNFLQKKKDAMISKTIFLRDESSIDKEYFLNKFAESNKWIADNFSGLMIDIESQNILSSIDWNKDRYKRICNAKILYEGLNNLSLIRPIYDEEDMDCPLFVPIVIKDGNRDFVRKKLIENKIYCPIHWPQPIKKCQSNLYDIELSLICDQRYDENDMRRIISVLEECENIIRD